jgi:hypothetical protein
MAEYVALKMVTRGVEAWNRWRRENPSMKPDLSGVGFNTSSCNLHDFRNANLSDVSFRGAEIWSADLSGCNLDRSAFDETDLYFVDLIGASLRNASLADTRLRNVDLDGADVSGTHFGRTEIHGVDLSAVRGLAETVHSGVSMIDTVTMEATACGLQVSMANLKAVEEFYRRAGVAEDLIIYFRTRIGKVTGDLHAFISYSHSDQAFARGLYQELQAAGIRCWLDEHELLPGDDIYEAVNDGIRRGDAILLCCSRKALTSWWVDREINAAFEKEQALSRTLGSKALVLIPLDLDGFIFELEGGKASELRSRFIADFTNWPSDADKFRATTARLVRSLEKRKGLLAQEAPLEKREGGR